MVVAGGRRRSVRHQDAGTSHLLTSLQNPQMSSNSRGADAKPHFFCRPRGASTAPWVKMCPGVSYTHCPPGLWAFAQKVSLRSGSPQGYRIVPVIVKQREPAQEQLEGGKMEEIIAATITESNPSPPRHWSLCWASSHPDPAKEVLF